MTASKATAPQGVALLEEALKVAGSERERANILLALMAGYHVQRDFANIVEVSSALLREVPESRRVFTETAWALSGLGRFDDAIALADERLKLFDNDSDALMMKMWIEEYCGNYTVSRAWGQKLIDQGKGDATLFNTLAWNSLFTGKVTEADIAMSIKSTQMSNDNSSLMHTLACLYAETGKTKEARDLLLRAMDERALDEPDDDFWYAFGRLAEQYGERDIAIADYRKLKKPDQVLAIPTSSYLLAQTRLKAMGTDEVPVGKRTFGA